MCFTPQQCYEAGTRSDLWADEDPAYCGCKGGGWFLSGVDTWHKCPVHKPDAPHPEDDEAWEWLAMSPEERAPIIAANEAREAKEAARKKAFYEDYERRHGKIIF